MRYEEALWSGAPPRRWWALLRVAANGRLEVRCLDCGALYWLSNHESEHWGACPHEAGWWILPSSRA